jgi:UDP-N-acetylmuramoylalanine--D-glutamate ligase
VCELDAFQLIGRHNVQNLLASIAVAWVAGVPLDGVERSVSEFPGVPHRLEFVREVNGVRWYNDSIATTPDRAIAAIEAFDRPIILLAGGRDKDLNWNRFVYVGLQAVRDLILFGEAAEKIERTVLAERSEEDQINLYRCSGMQEAIERAASLAQDGDVVLLSPGATSFDEFPNYELRGDRFKEWVSEL